MTFHARTLFVAAFFYVAAGSASAAPVFYTSLSADSLPFTGAAASAGISLTVDDFEDLGVGLIDYGQNLARTGYDISAASSVGGVALRSSSFAGDPIEGSVSMVLFNSTDPLTFSFSAPINAFGITFRDFDMSFFGGELTVSIDGGAPQTLLTSGSGDDLVYFFGVIDDAAAFSSIAFDRTVGDGYFFDIVRHGALAVPEPGTLALLGLGLAGLAAARRRKQ